MSELMGRYQELLDDAKMRYINNPIKPCPFCGGEANLTVIEAHTHKMATFMPDYPGGVFIECSGCTVAMSSETEEEATTLWNKRVQSMKDIALPVKNVKTNNPIEPWKTVCPNCDSRVGEGCHRQKHCHNCGQRITYDK